MKDLSPADMEALADRRQEEAREWFGQTECPQCGASNQTEAAEDEDSAPYCSQACARKAAEYVPVVEFDPDDPPF